jgi:hypothetical protein
MSKAIGAWFKDAALAAHSQPQSVNVFQQMMYDEFFSKEGKTVVTISVLKRWKSGQGSAWFFELSTSSG